MSDFSHASLRRSDGGGIDVAITDALDRLDARRQRVRDPETGRWTTGNGGRLVTGLSSDSFWRDLEDARRDIEQAVKRQLGLDADDAPETALGLAGALAEARLIRRSEFLQLARMEDVPVARQRRKQAAERRRQHLHAWATAVDREMRL